MLAIIKAAPGPGFVETNLPQPAPGLDEVLLKVRAASICGTDLHLYDWNDWAASRVRPPRIVGHEVCGEVVGSGREANGVREGTLVATESHVVCHACKECRNNEEHVCRNTKILGVDRDGGFAEYIAVPAMNIWPLWEGVDIGAGSALEPVGNAVHAASTCPLEDAVVLVTGCGPIGAAACAVARAYGASRVLAADLSQYRVDLALSMGATDGLLVDPSESMETQIRDAVSGEIDAVLEMSGALSAVSASMKVVRPGGHVALLGLGDHPVSVDFSTDVIMRGLTLHGVVGRKLFSTWEETTRLIQEGLIDMDTLITERKPFSLTSIDAAVAEMKRGESGKIVLIQGDTP